MRALKPMRAGLVLALALLAGACSDDSGKKPAPGLPGLDAGGDPDGLPDGMSEMDAGLLPDDPDELEPALDAGLAEDAGTLGDGAVGDGAVLDGSLRPVLASCVERPDDLPRPPSSVLPCELLPPGLSL